METLDTTEGLLARVLADLDMLIGWARADMEASRDNGSLDQARHDRHRVDALLRSRNFLSIAQSYGR